MKAATEDLFAHIESGDEAVGGLDSYLQMSYLTISLANRPLHAKEILALAKQYGVFPKHLKGRTPHKTLNARLSEHIRSLGGASIFFRTAPATYYISTRAEQTADGNRYKVFRGHRRHKSIKKESVLVAPKSTLHYLTSTPISPFTNTPISSFDNERFVRFFHTHCYFTDRAHAEKNDQIKQFVTFTVFHFEQQVLIHRRGQHSTASDELRGAYSVGFGGHVNDSDFDLFAKGGRALVNNSSRELREELFLEKTYKDIDAVSKRSSIVGFINVDDTEDAKHHVAVLIAFRHKNSTLPKKGELSINNLHWLDTSHPMGDLSEYDLWSRMILEAIYKKQVLLESVS